jgi:hypothetical protein
MDQTGRKYWKKTLITITGFWVIIGNRDTKEFVPRFVS